MITDAIADYLALQGIGTVATNIFVDYLPDTANAIDTGIFSTGGLEPEIFYIDRFTIQVRTRGNSPVAAYNKLAAIYNELHNKDSFVLPDGTYVVSIRGLQPQPNNIGKDAKNRQEYTLNFLVKVHNPTRYS